LERRFPQDIIAPVPRGMRGADLLQEVREAGRPCGSIVWETKNTKHWQPSWLDKLKQDQRAGGASLAVLVSVALPHDMAEYARIDGGWVTGRRAGPGPAVALREQLMQVARAHAAADGRQEKMDFLYRYLAGEEFRSRVEALVEAFVALQGGL